MEPEAAVRDRLDELLAGKIGGGVFDPAAMRAARRILGLSQLEAAHVIGCSYNTYSSWERGLSTPGPVRLRRAAAQFIRSADEALDAAATDAGERLHGDEPPRSRSSSGA